MVCCCMPCFHKLQRRFDPVPGTGRFTLCVSEIIRWICIMVPVYLTAWRYMELIEGDLTTTFWGILTGVLLGFSLFIYLPLKLLGLNYRMKNNRLKDYRWRPSIVVYIVLCALPCFILMIIAIEKQVQREECSESTEDCTLDEITTAVLQIVVLGLTITEWMSKIREEHITYELITAMTLDFFFAYDCIQFIMLCTYDRDIYTSNWVYVCFLFAFIAMFRYIPAQPVGVVDKGSSIGTAICIIVSIFTVDVPFVIVRVSTMIQYGLAVSDIIHPLKNIAMICFGSTQLYIIYETRKKMALLRDKPQVKDQDEEDEQVKRRSRNPGVWDLDRGDEYITTDDVQESSNATIHDGDTGISNTATTAWEEADQTELKETQHQQKSHKRKNQTSSQKRDKNSDKLDDED